MSISLLSLADLAVLLIALAISFNSTEEIVQIIAFLVIVSCLFIALLLAPLMLKALLAAFLLIRSGYLQRDRYQGIIQPWGRIR